jgi:uncharacterized protein with HEPN domain
MRPERLYLQDILDASDRISRLLAGTEPRSLPSDERTSGSLLHNLMVIGEAASKVSKSFQKKHHEVPWADIVAFRNFIVHEYFGLDWEIVWEAATQDVPLLRRQIAAILATEYSDET